MKPLIFLFALLPALWASPVRAEDGGQKKSLDQYLEESGLFRDFLSDPALSQLERLCAAVDPRDLARTEKPLKQELTAARESQLLFIRWRGDPKTAKAECGRDAAAFNAKWEKLGRYIAPAMLDKLKKDAGIGQSEDPGWFEQLKEYVCRTKPTACVP